MAALTLSVSDELLDQLADLVAARVAARVGNGARGAAGGDGWLTSREAAEHLGLTLGALHRLTSSRAVPFSQDRPGARCWFRRDDLDLWREEGRRGPR